jgi:hypothetical protein
MDEFEQLKIENTNLKHTEMLPYFDAHDHTDQVNKTASQRHAYSTTRVRLDLRKNLTMCIQTSLRRSPSWFFDTLPLHGLKIIIERQNTIGKN